MGDDNDKEKQGTVTPKREAVYDFAGAQRDASLSGQSDLEKEYIPQSQQFFNAYSSSAGRQRNDYDVMMDNYARFGEGANRLTQSIQDRRPGEIAYNRSGDMGQAMGGYSNFANTGGYSGQDIQEMRARGMAPIRSAYGNTMQEMDRARALGGAGGSANYISAASKAQRELPGQLADATTNVNAGLAEQIRSGRLQGLQGLQQGALSEAGLDLKAKELNEQGLSAWEARQMAAQDEGLKALQGQTNLFGTTPGMTAAFGNQALQAYQQRNQLEQMKQQFGTGMTEMQLRALGEQAPPGKPWWQTGMEVGGNIASAAILASSRDYKEDIKELSSAEIIDKFKKLPIFSWKYKGDDEQHVGPMAEDFQEIFGLGDGKSIMTLDAIGVLMALGKVLAERQSNGTV